MQNTQAIDRPATLAVSHERMANAIRALSMDAVEKAQSGHPGMPMGMADVATVLFSRFLKFDPKNPHWPDRDRFVLSAGHGSMLLYSLLYLTGYEDMTIEQIKNFRQLHSKTCGHPEYGEAAGIETTTGPLGQGIANAVGMALAEKMLRARYGEEIVHHHTYAIAGDGCLMEGISQEAITLAGHLKLGHLIVLWDDNRISIDGPTSLTTSEDQCKRFEAAGWHVQAIDGHDPVAIEKALHDARHEPNKPSMIACRTTIAKGAPTKAGTAASHGSPLGAKEIEGARAALGWSHAPFEVPADVLDAWRSVAEHGANAYAVWEKRLAKHKDKVEFKRTQAGKLPAAYKDAIQELKKAFSAADKMATRQSSGKTLEKLFPAIPELIGGSADLTGSNLTQQGLKAVTPDDASGRYIFYGVREHGMCAAMNGMALHKGMIPYGGTFFVFTDYCRPSIRLAALMKQRVVYVMTHDSIGLGEDGPTHQPVEHLASLRAMPNLYMYRPADAVEVAECWELSLERTDAPSMLVLTRQAVPTLRKEHAVENMCKKGGYVISDFSSPLAGEHGLPLQAGGEKASADVPPTESLRSSTPPQGGSKFVTLIATGSEVSLAIEAQEKLAKEGIASRVVSMPCTTLFDKQSKSYRKSVIPAKGLKVAIEAGANYGWEKYIGSNGIFIGMPGFGASAPAGDLYRHFGITVENIVEKVKAKL